MSNTDQSNQPPKQSFMKRAWQALFGAGKGQSVDKDAAQNSVSVSSQREQAQQALKNALARKTPHAGTAFAKSKETKSAIAGHEHDYRHVGTNYPQVAWIPRR